MKEFKLIKMLREKNADIFGKKAPTVVFLGDSVTQGCFETFSFGYKQLDGTTEAANSYAACFGKIMSVLFPKVPLNIINSGIGGGSAANGLSRLQRDVLDYNPDLVIVCFGLNDSCGGHEYLSEYCDNLRKIFTTLNEKNIDCIFMTPNMMNTYVSGAIKDTYLKEIAGNFEKIQNGGLLGQFITEAKNTAKKCGVAVCDCYGKWEKLNKNGIDTTVLLSNLLNHPSREMQWLFAFSLAETVLSL